MSQQQNQITRKMDFSRVALSVALVAGGIAVVIWNFTPDQFGTVKISLQMIALEALLILGGGALFFQSFKAKFCAVCNKALTMDSKVYALEDEQKLMDYLTKHDTKAFSEAKSLDTHLAENAVVLTREYCQQCQSVGCADLTKFDDSGKGAVLLKGHPLDAKHF